MSRVKKTEAPLYELLFIISNQYSEDETKPIIEKAANIITGNEGKITKTEDWGKKRLAYPIKHFTFGYYTLFEFTVDGPRLEKINRELRLSSDILRYQIVSKLVKSEAKIKKDQAISEKIAAKAALSEKVEKAKEIETEKAKDKNKVDLKDLDEKLDKILETDDLL